MADDQRALDATIEPLLIDGPALARRLCISVSTLHSLRRAGRMPLRIIRLARCVRFDRAEVDAWIRAGCPAAERWRAINLGRRAG